MVTNVTVPVWDLDTGEVIEMEISQDFIDAMDAAHAEIAARREAARRRDQELMRYDRD